MDKINDDQLKEKNQQWKICINQGDNQMSSIKKILEQNDSKYTQSNQNKTVEQEILEFLADHYQLKYQIIYDVAEKLQKGKDLIILVQKYNRKLYDQNLNDDERADSYIIINPYIPFEYKKTVISSLSAYLITKENNFPQNTNLQLLMNEKQKQLQNIALIEVLKFYKRSSDINPIQIQNPENLNNQNKGIKQVEEQCAKIIREVRALLKYGPNNNREYAQRNPTIFNSDTNNNSNKEEQQLFVQQDQARQKFSLKRIEAQRWIVNQIVSRSNQNSTDFLDKILLIIKYQSGNCGECALTAFLMLQYSCHKDIEIEIRKATTKKTNPNELGDHMYVAIKPKNIQDDSQTLIIDPWPANQLINPTIVNSNLHFCENEFNYTRAFSNQVYGSREEQGNGYSWENVQLLDPIKFQEQPIVDERLVKLIYSIFESNYQDERIDSPAINQD